MKRWEPMHAEACPATSEKLKLGYEILDKTAISTCAEILCFTVKAEAFEQITSDSSQPIIVALGLLHSTLRARWTLAPLSSKFSSQQS